ncbi:MAG TPA: cadherin repeat domain-containing protein [Salinimicrobium sp.]|nr:cadherin repeat domain-containing protein [Salinimicrobium sp.]
MMFLSNRLYFLFSFCVVILLFSCSSDDSEETGEIIVTAANFEVTIDENPEPGQVLGIIEGSTNQGTVIFSIDDQTPDGAFNIDENSGELTVADETLFKFDLNPVLNAVVSVTNADVVEYADVVVNLEQVINLEGVIWQKVLYTTGGNYQRAERILQNADGTYTIGGLKILYSGGPDWFSKISKINEIGELVWDTDFGGTTEFSDLESTNDNGYIIGTTQAVSADFSTSYRIYKFNGSGNVQWHETIGGSLSDILTAAEPTNDGGYILGGYSNSNISENKDEDSEGGFDYWVVKVNSSGQIEWQNTIGGSSEDALRSISQTTDGGYILAGESNSDISGDKTENSRGGTDFWIVKIAEGGEIEWQKTIGGDSDEALSSIVTTSDGGAVIAGYTDSGLGGEKTEGSNGSTDIWIVKISSIGNIEWQNTIGGNNIDKINAISQTADSGFILASSSKSNATGDKTEDSRGDFDYWLIKLDSAGNIEWQDTLGGDAVDILTSVEEGFDGKYILAGYSTSGISGDKTEDGPSIEHYWIIKYNPE